MSSAAPAIAYGGTRWRRFALIFGASFAAVATIIVLMSTGVLAAPVTISGTTFKVTADSLVAHQNPNGPAFIQYGYADLYNSNTKATGVAVTDLPAGGVLTNMNQVVCGPTGLGALNSNWAYLIVTLKADQANATGGLVVDATSLNAGTATFHNIQIGVPAPAGIPDPGAKGSFAQTADGVAINTLDQQAVFTQAGTFRLTNLGLSAHLSDSCPY